MSSSLPQQSQVMETDGDRALRQLRAFLAAISKGARLKLDAPDVFRNDFDRGYYLGLAQAAESALRECK